MTTQYSGGIDGNIRYHSKKTLRVGVDEIIVSSYPVPEINRAVIIFDMKQAIENTLSTKTDYITGNEYSVNNAHLRLTSVNGKTAGNLYAFMLPINSPVDESVSWFKPTEKSGVNLEEWVDGGAIEPLAKAISTKGQWNGNEIQFDITPFVNIWISSKNSTFGIIIASDETTKEIWEFYSQQSETPLIGGQQLTNISFLGSGDTNSINTEGILVKISLQLPYLTIESADPSAKALNRWAAFNASVSIGDTFSMFLPDLNTNSQVYTLLDKRNSETEDIQLIVSGSTAGFETTKHATGEFSCVGKVQSGSGIVEFSYPDNSLKVDLNTVLPNDTIIFDYKPTITPNNATSFTVDFYSDETLKNDRARLYLKQQTASENRSGLNTSVKKSSVRPRLSLTLSF